MKVQEQIVDLPQGFDPGAVPHLDQFFGQWAVEPVRFMQMVHFLGRANLSTHVSIQQKAEPRQESGDGRSYPIINNGLAVFSIQGTMTKYGSSLGGGGTIKLRRSIRNALADTDVRGGLLKIDSPGGQAAGTKELADEVFKFSQQKPMVTFFEDMGASAAFYAGSQSTETFINESGMAGSIGTLLILQNFAAAAEKAGIKFYVFGTGQYKGAGFPGRELSEADQAYFQGLINEGNKLFLRDVGRGTGLSMSAIRDLEAKVFLAAEAKKIGLVDNVGTFDDAVNRAVSLMDRRKVVSMSVQNEPTVTPAVQVELAETSATLSQLKAACPGADSDFLLTQLEAHATVQAAQTAFILHLQQQPKEEPKLETPAVAPEQQLPGNPVEPELADETPDGDAEQQWEAIVNEFKASGMTAEAAVLKADERHPGLRAEMLKVRGGFKPNTKVLMPISGSVKLG